MILLFNSIRWGGAPAKGQVRFTTAASIAARQRSENAGPRLFGILFFDAAPHLEYIFQFMELNTKVKIFISCYRTPGPQKGSEGFQKGSLKGSLKVFRRVLGF